MSAAPPLLFLSLGSGPGGGGLKPNKTIQEIRIVKLAATESQVIGGNEIPALLPGSPGRGFVEED